MTMRISALGLVLLCAAVIPAATPQLGGSSRESSPSPPMGVLPPVAPYGLLPGTLLPSVRVDVYFTRQTDARPVGFDRAADGELWFLEADSVGNLVHLLPSVPADTTFEMNPIQAGVVPDTFSAASPAVYTVPPLRCNVQTVVTAVSGDSSGAFVRYRIPTNSSWSCDLEAHDMLFFTERDSAKLATFDPGSMSEFKEWRLPTNGSYPVGLLAVGDTVFFVEADSCRLGRLVVSGSEITEWDIPNTSNGWPGYPGLDRDSIGNLWLTCSRGPHLLVKVEIGTGDTARLSEWTVPGDPDQGPADVRVDGAGEVWYSIQRVDTSGTASKIGMLDLAAQQYREWLLPSDTMGVYYLELATDGAVWFNGTNGSCVGRLSPARDSVTTYPISLPNGYVYDYAFDGLGNLWVAGYSDRAILKFSGVAAGVAEAYTRSGLGPRLTAHPNPFRARVSCPSFQRFAVFDGNGRRIADVDNGFWDGRNRSGQNVPAGVYYLSASGSRTAVVRLR